MAQEITWEPAPSWVEPLPLSRLPDRRKDLIEDGVFYALNDLHIRWENGERVLYSRLATQIVSYSGLEKAATVTRTFDPAFERISLVSVDIVRGGERISLREQIEPLIFRREKDLEDGIINGELTLHITLPAVQIGDVVDVVVVYHSRPVVDNLGHQYRRVLDWSEPEGVTRMTVDWEKDRPYFETVTARDLKKTTRKLGKWVRHRWLRRDAEPVFAENGVPKTHEVWGRLELSDLPDWWGVVTALLGFYTPKHDVPEGFLADVARLAQSDMSEREKALRTLFLVQDRVRYVGLEVGVGGYIARKPVQVARNRYGDCKDKAVLLKTILAALGISSDVVLVHATLGAELVNRQPSLFAFNHMIVRVNLKSGPLWVDPTRTFQGGAVSGFTPPDYHWGLVIAKGVRALQEIPLSSESVHRREVIERFTFNDHGLDLQVATTSEGLEANWYRWKQATKSKYLFGRQLEAYYRSNYAGLRQARDIVYQDNRDENTFVLTETYHIDKEVLFPNGLVRTFGFKPDGFHALYTPPETWSRRYPLQIKHPYNYVHKVEIHNPPMEMEPPKNFRFTSSQFSFSFSSGDMEDGIYMRWSIETHQAQVVPEQFVQWKDNVALMADKLYFEWDLAPAENDDSLFTLLQKAYDKARKNKNPQTQ